MCWAHRGKRAGLTLTTLCALADREPKAILAQIDAARRALKRTRSPWRLIEEAGVRGADPTFWLVSRSCPRPAPRKPIPTIYEPEIVSFSELGDEFPGDVPGLNECLRIAKES